MRALAIQAMVAATVLFTGGVAHGHAQTRAPLQLRAGDALRIEIKDEPKLSGDFDIGDDGAVLLPTLGMLRIAERSFADVQRDLLAAYQRELVNPVVRVTPLVRVAVLGEIRQPGLLLVDPTYTMSDVLAKAGGLNPTANTKKIVLQRLNGSNITFAYDVAPPELRPASGDKIVVERRGWASEHLGVLLAAAGSVGVALITGAILR